MCIRTGPKVVYLGGLVAHVHHAVSVNDHHVGLRFPTRRVAQAQERRSGRRCNEEVSAYYGVWLTSADV